jgi:hypothetical protein
MKQGKSQTEQEGLGDREGIISSEWSKVIFSHNKQSRKGELEEHLLRIEKGKPRTQY